MAATTERTPLFGANVDPSAEKLERAMATAQLADSVGLDIVGVQDHPYNPEFLDTWTLLAALGATTKRVKLLPNVLNLPLRPPAMLAKAAASLDLITGGRVELGLGAGAFWQGVAAYGGPERTPGEAVEALEEGMQVIRALWHTSERTVDFQGKHYQLNDAQPGPAPAHPIGIWLGALKPRMLRLTGERADGWIVSAGYVPPEEVGAMQSAIDEAALAAGRTPNAIRRGYNLVGIITQPGQGDLRAARPGIIVGPVERWVEEIARYCEDLRMDTFIFWPVGVDKEGPLRLFAEEVVPAVRSALASGVA